MAEHVPDRREPVLDVVVDLARQLTERRTAFRVPDGGRTRAQPLGHGAEDAGQDADFILTPSLEIYVETVEVDARGFVGELDQRAADP